MQFKVSVSTALIFLAAGRSISALPLLPALDRGSSSLSHTDIESTARRDAELTKPELDHLHRRAEGDIHDIQGGNWQVEIGPTVPSQTAIDRDAARMFHVPALLVAANWNSSN